MSAPPRSLSFLARAGLIYGIAEALRRVASVIMLPVYTRTLTPSDYAVLHLLELTVDVAAIALSGGVTAGVIRFYYKGEHEADRRALVASAWWFLFATNALGAVALVLLAPLIAERLLDGHEHAHYVWIVSGTFFVRAWTLVPFLFLQARQLATLHSLLSIVRLLAQLGLNVLFLVGFGWGVEGVLWSNFATSLVLGIGMTAFMLRQTGLVPQATATRALLRFGLPYQLAEAGTFILTFGDRYFLKASRGLEDTGLYSLAYQFGFLAVLIGSSPLFRAWNPQRFEVAAQPRAERDAFYNEGLLFIGIVLVSVSVGISLFVRPVLAVMSDPAYLPAAALVPILVLAYVFQAGKDVVEFGIQMSERTGFATLATWVSVAVILVGYAALIPPLGGLGAALATLAGFALRFALFAWFAQRLWPVSYRWGRQLLLLGYGAAVVALFSATAPRHLPAELALASGLFLAFLALVAYGGVVDAGERRRVLARLRAALGRAA